MAHPRGFEPLTSASGGQKAYQLPIVDYRYNGVYKANS